MRHRKFFSLEQANQAIGELPERLKHRPFRKREGSRASVFAELDRPALKPLPDEPFELSQWLRARVNIDYHVAFDGNSYSVPYNLVHEQVEVRATATTVEILHKGTRVASHIRSRQSSHPHGTPAQESPGPPGMATVTADRLARKVGPHTARLVERMLADKPHPEMGYRACLGIMRLARTYSFERMEAASKRGLLMGACRYRSVESILRNSLDRQPLAQPAAPPLPPPHDNIRGAGYFE